MAEPILVPRSVLPHLRVGLLAMMSLAAEQLSTLTVTGAVTRAEAYRSSLLVIDVVRALLDKVGITPPPEESELSLESDEFPLLVLRVLRSRYALGVRARADKSAGRLGLGVVPSGPDDEELRNFVVALSERVQGTPQARQEAVAIDAVIGVVAPNRPIRRRR